MYTTTQRVCASHTDTNGRLKLVSALDMMQDCTHLWMESEPVFTRYLHENGLVLLAASRQLDVVRVPLFGEKLTVSTSVYSCRKYFGYRNTAIYDEQGTPCLLSWSMGVFVNREDGRIIQVPREVTDALALDPQIEMRYLDKKIDLPAADIRPLPPFPARRADIDFNRHVNNARYVEAALELLPHDAEPNRVRIEYKNPARLGDILYPAVARVGGVYYVVLADEGGRPYTITEFAMEDVS